jgi:hypothetical protein
MNEISGDAAIYLPRLAASAEISRWARAGAQALLALLNESEAQRLERSVRAIAWAGRFTADAAIERYLAIYRRVLGESGS